MTEITKSKGKDKSFLGLKLSGSAMQQVVALVALVVLYVWGCGRFLGLAMRPAPGFSCIVPG